MAMAASRGFGLLAIQPASSQTSSVVPAGRRPRRAIHNDGGADYYRERLGAFHHPAACLPYRGQFSTLFLDLPPGHM
jgi:hypothetical protein